MENETPIVSVVEDQKVTFKTFENISSIKEIPDAIKIREIVFMQEQNVPISLEYDEYDTEAIHVVMYIGNEAVGNGRIIEVEGKWYVGRVAILKEFRGKSYGKILMQEIIQVVKRKGIKEVFIHAQTQAISFYEKLGWKIFGEEFEEAGIIHRHMSYKISGECL